MFKNKKLVLIFVLSAFLISCNGAEEKINVSELIEKGKVEIAGHSFDLFYDSVITYKYDGENIVEQLDKNQKVLWFYDEDILYKHEVYSSSSDKLYATFHYTYDNDGREIRKESVVEQTKDRLHQITSYEKNFKTISYYDKNDELSSVGEIELNDKQEMIKYSSKSSDGTLESVSYYKYKEGNLIFHQSTVDNKVIREIYYKYNEYGDQVAVISVNFVGRKSLGGMNKNPLDAVYYDNKYEDSKLVQQTLYTLQAELDEEQFIDIVNSLK